MQFTTIGHTIIELPAVDSTNRYVSDLLKAGHCADGSVFWTKEQFAGRGQRGNLWLSETGQNLCFSIGFTKLPLAPSAQFQLNRAVSVGLLNYVRSLVNTGTATIKWPNDILVNDKKVAGLLIEAAIRGQQLHQVVIGIGLNLNQELFNELPNAASLRSFTGQQYNLQQELNTLLGFIDVQLLHLFRNKTAELETDYSKSLYRLRTWHLFEKGGIPGEYKIEGVSAEGLLQLTDRAGASHNCAFKEIAYIL